MKVMALQRQTTMADTQTANGQVADETRHFARLLDEKKEAAASASPAAAGERPQVHVRPVIQRAKSSDGDPAEETTAPPAEGTDVSLLTWLNPPPVSRSPEAGEKQGDLTPAEAREALPAPLPVESAVSPARLPTSDSRSQPTGLLPSATLAFVMPDRPLAADAGTEEGEPPVDALFSLPSSSTSASAPAAAVRPGAQQPAQPTGNSSADPSVAPVPLSSSPELAALKADPLPAINTLTPVRPALSFRGEGEGTPQPDTLLTSFRGAPSASESPANPSPATGQLTQEMGTPAWQQALGQQVACFTRNGIQHAELRLHPKELGSLQISLQLKNEQAELHFVSPSHQVRAAIEAAVPHLRTSLAESGIALGQSSVGAGSSQDGNPSGSAGQSFRPQGIPSQPGDRPASAEEPADAVIPAVSYRNGINTFA
ncbi:flagellar hook-length control protein FliK [Pantoea anthophila]|uniref:flagellar hook-length control protein FliK n=1 Tax=Pantoea anthophila TaxID=470931 RepID=UPI002DBE5FD3|nr:flagellar hook-length control protein FliK [Pantoea anthophila]MEB7539693.1 flagellar hook-length control protein FliK [Pantoea anthophila]